jgi:hypothetical protein
MDRQHAQRVLGFQALRKVPIETVLDKYNLLSDLKRIGTQLFGVCPIHGSGKNRKQFVVDPQKNLWVCHGDCGRGGGALELVAELERISVRDAALLVGSWFAIQSGTVISQQSNRRRKSMAGERPSHKYFVVEPREEGSEEKAFWTRVGSAWPHSDGKGLNIQLATGVAVSGRLVLREYTDEDAKQEEQQRSSAKRKK